MSQISPSINIQERNLSTYIPNYTSEVACFCGNFEKGPINTPIFITDINDFKFIFGRGVDEYHNDWYQVYNYLQYSSGIWIARTAGVRFGNACSNPIDAKSFNTRTKFYEETQLIVDDFMVFAQTPGYWGNLLKVAVIGDVEYNENVHVYNEQNATEFFDFFEENHVGILIFRKDKLVEKYYIHIDDINDVNTKSAYIYLRSNTLQYYYDDHILDLRGGFSLMPTDVQIEETYDIFSNVDTYDIDIVIGNDKHNKAGIDLAEKRKDCIAYIGLPSSFIEFIILDLGIMPQEVLYSEEGLVVVVSELKIAKILTDEHFTKLKDYIESIPFSQYCHFTINVKEQYDGFTERKKLINIAGDIAGLKARASTLSPFVTAAGLERGQIKNASAFFVTLKNGTRNKYYKEGMNFVQGGVLMSQKTYWNKPSSFNRVNVRHLFNYIERGVQKTLRRYVFTENTRGLRGQIASEIKKYLMEIKSNRGIQNGKVYVYAKGEDIIVEITIQPMYVAEQIQIRYSNIGANILSEIII